MILAKLVLPPVVTTNNCREYRNYQARRTALRRPAVVASNYDDYYYYDYDYSSDYRDGFLARIVKAVNEKKLVPGRKSEPRSKGILAGSVRKDFRLTEELLEDLENLPPLQDIDFEDFEQQVEVIARNSGLWMILTIKNNIKC